MARPRGRYSLALFAVATVITVAFALSMVFHFGVSTHRSTSLSWNASTAGFGIVQFDCYYGQFHLVIDFAKPSPPRGAAIVDRTWHAGAAYYPGVRTHLRKTDRWISRIGVDGFLVRSGTYFSVGVFGLYPSVLAWVGYWMYERKRRTPAGMCAKCGYDLRATPHEGGALLDRCPECGHVPLPARVRRMLGALRGAVRPIARPLSAAT